MTISNRHSSTDRVAPVRRTRLFALGVIFACVAAAATPLHAQTCAAPESLPLSPARPIATASTCSTQEAGLVLCHGNVVTHGPSHVFSLTIGAGNTATLSLAGSGVGMYPIMYLAGSGCDAGDCLASTSSLSLRDVPPGNYSLIVTSSDLDANGACGTFMLSLDGDLGGGDVVFASGFD
jgi:hypothetical protein